MVTGGAAMSPIRAKARPTHVRSFSDDEHVLRDAFYEELEREEAR